MTNKLTGFDAVLSGTPVDDPSDIYWSHGANEFLRREGLEPLSHEALVRLEEVLPAEISEEDIPLDMRVSLFKGVNLEPGATDIQEFLKDAYTLEQRRPRDQGRDIATHLRFLVMRQFDRDLPGVSTEDRWAACRKWTQAPGQRLSLDTYLGSSEIPAVLTEIASDPHMAITARDRAGMVGPIVANSRAAQRGDRYLSSLTEYTEENVDGLAAILRQDNLQGLVARSAEIAKSASDFSFEQQVRLAQKKCITSAVAPLKDGSKEGEREALTKQRAIERRQKLAMEDGFLSDHMGSFNAILADMCAQNGHSAPAARLLGIEAGRLERLGMDIAALASTRPQELIVTRKPQDIR